MPRNAAFAPKRLPRRALPWCVDVPARLSESGKRERRFFETREAAVGFAAVMRTRVAHHGTQQILLAPEVRREAVAAEQLLEPFGLGLLESVEQHLQALRELGDFAKEPGALQTATRHFATWRAEQSKSVSFETLATEFLTLRESHGISRGYRGQVEKVRSSLGPALAQIGTIAAVNARQLEDAMHAQGWSPATFAAYRRVVSAILAHGVRREYLQQNLVAKIAPPRLAGRDVSVLSLIQAKALLQGTPPRLLPFIAIGLFAGLRPTEILRLDWRDIDLPRRRLFVRPKALAKERSGRLVPIEENLHNWLLPHRQDAGLVVPPENFRWRFRDTRRNADGLLVQWFAEEPDRCAREAILERQWVQDAMRHTCASAWSSLHEDLARTSRWLGHSEHVHRRHYLKSMPAEAAKEYFAILPEGPRQH